MGGRLGHGEVPGGFWRSNPFKSFRKVERVPRRVRGVPAAREMFVGPWVTFIKTERGDVWGWGDGGSGVLANGREQVVAVPEPIQALTDLGVRKIAVGHSHAAAITYSGDLYTWGLNQHGELGQGNDIGGSPFFSRLFPVPVPYFQQLREHLGGGVRDVAAGWRFTVAAAGAGGEVFAFGSGLAGRLGTGAEQDAWGPEQVWEEEGVPMAAQRLYAGMAHTVAVQSEDAPGESSGGAGGGAEGEEDSVKDRNNLRTM
mmetsp:Transcript_18594/g.46624  ORF Transcript_18594/g.46624 Transcript_18594/m.46624 type:complete len:257 (+) Transcript_18594:276-1046(+)